MSNCTCGRTTRPPFCDHSHALTEQEYQQRTQKLNLLKNKIQNRTWIDAVAESLPEHSSALGEQLRGSFDNLPSTLSLVDAHAVALVAAISSGNGELAFEIGMNGPLMGTEQRETAKATAVKVYTHHLSSRAVNIMMPEIAVSDFETDSPLLALAAAVTLGDKGLMENLGLNTELDFAVKIAVIGICTKVAAIGKVIV